MLQSTRHSALATAPRNPSQAGPEVILEPEYAHLKGKRVGLVVMSPYPIDPRPYRAANALVRQGMKVDYICLADGKAPMRETSNGVNVFRIPIVRSRGGKAAYAYEYARFILASAALLAARSLGSRYDLIYVNNMPDILIASALLPKIFGAKVIHDLHDPMPELMETIFAMDPSSKSVKLIKRLERWSLARADRVFTPNLACRRLLAERGCAPEKIGVVMNSPDESIFHFCPARSRPVLIRNTDPAIRCHVSRLNCGAKRRGPCGRSVRAGSHHCTNRAIAHLRKDDSLSGEGDAVGSRP